MSTEVRVPTLGESVTEATVATWFKKPGDAVAVDEMLCELETDKVTVEVPAPVAGVLTEIVAAEGTTVGVAALLAQISEGASAAATSAAPAPEAKAEPAPAAAPAAARDVEDAPSAKKLMAEKGRRLAHGA
ncbi:MAG: dihydrolipoamide succinyltransferase, partial [Rhodobacteraceae bacterium]|nr:dihydrolipoamide succinyltransferase [Paracoccaceae bacterium]